MARIELQDVSLTFQVTKYGPVSFRDWVATKLAPRYAPTVKQVRALRNVNLRVDDGDRLGIVGLNGAGKSTLLRVLADIYPPTAGTRRVEGRISSLFDILLGFQAHATGWDNIRYRSYLQGETPRSVRKKIKAIGEFSGLGPYLNMPVHYYSTGMRVRLAFSIATAIEPEILLVDEAIGAGDIHFRGKAKERMRGVMSGASIVVAVSHDHNMLKEICDRMVWLEHGSVRAEGPPDEIVRAYEQHAREQWYAAQRESRRAA